MPNIEIKARYRGLARARRIAIGLKARRVGVDRQTDTYFVVKRGRLKLRVSRLGGAQLIPYNRPDRKGPKKSDYLLIPVPDPDHCAALLHELLGTEVVVAKVREIFLLGNVRIHLDKVEGLGEFFEFEAVYRGAARAAPERRKVERLMRLFGIRPRDLLTGSYRELMLAAKRRR